MSAKPIAIKAKDRLQSEQGAALILAMATVVVMTLLGLVIMNVLLNSNRQVAASEASIQAELLAQKGLDEVRVLIQAAVDQANEDSIFSGSSSLSGLLGESGASSTRDKIDAANHALANLKDRLSESAYTKNIPALKGSYTISVEEWSDNAAALAKLPPTNPEHPYIEKIVITSTGTIPGKSPYHVVKKQMELYVSTIHPVFRYPVSAEGNVVLNGFPYIVGDVLAKGEFIYSNEAQFVGRPGAKDPHPKETNLPAIKGFIKAGGGYTNRLTSSHSPDWKPEYFFKSYFPFEDKGMDTGMANVENINIASYFIKQSERMSLIAGNSHYTTISSAGLVGPELGIGTLNGGKLAGPSKITDQWATISGDLETVGDLAVIGGVLAVRSATTVTLKGGSLYVTTRAQDPLALESYTNPGLVAADLSGTMNIDAGQQISVEGNVALNSGFAMKGTGSMYVNGDLQILGDINVDGTIYVNGKVDLKGMSSINADLKKPLIVVASGNIDFSNNNLNTEEQEVHAFLYSQKDMNVYGVLSRIKIYGGIHGHNITLNAVGRVEGNVQDVAYANGDTFKFTPDQTSLSADKSLLKVLYNETLYEDILQSYSDLDTAPPIRIPTMDKLDVYVKSITYGKKP
ncbi:hypothetical protein [Paenibacillus agricola]|uniref:Uncharacterized protein n=1 Tax=Paenibacillus agricola TaxID=2716264 RepID=A0ABX0J164_9BACL|nr:hypothetical protein [Paenibacillus agricola]NHN29571.1 hypothetical protein [Paenibacillus agricola]